MTTSPFAIRPLTIPSHVEATDASDFRALVELDNLVCRVETGHDHFRSTAGEQLPAWLDQVDNARIGFLAVRGDDLVGAVTITMPTEPGSETLEFDLFPHPDHADEGIEDALLDVVERIAEEHRRPIAQTWSLHPHAADGRRLPSPTGFGTIPLDDRQTQFLLRRGFTFEQCERNSVFDLHADTGAVERMLADALVIAGDDYRLVTWSAPTPAEYADGFAYAMSRMDTDVPSGGMVFEEQTWDAARIARRDQRMLNGGHTVSVAAVQHVPTGTIAAFNELAIGADLTGTTHQYGTLALREHRGRRLGTIVKCANLLRWRELVPTSPRVSTFNAEENRHMLDINEAIGFIAVSSGGAWKKVLALGGTQPSRGGR